MKPILLNDKTRTVRVEGAFDLIEYWAIPRAELNISGAGALGLMDLTAGLPQIGDQHTLFPLLFLEQVVCKWIEDKVMIGEVELTYRNRFLVNARVGASLTSRQRWMALGATGEYDVPIETSGAGETQRHAVAVREATDHIEVTNTHVIGVHPMVHKRIYQGKVNSAPWPPSLLDPIGEWFCEKVSFPNWAPTMDRVVAVYEFVHNPDGWKAEVTQEVDGKPDPEASLANNGIKQYNLYPQANFANLGFTWL